jgi:ABC-type phosphate transport system substrate-binding protein
MKSSKQYLPILAGALVLAGLAGTAQAQTTELNGGGSSAARNFMTDIPLNLCDAGTSPANFPNRFASADGNKITWVCNRTGLPVIIRYSATGSSDGVNKLLQPASSPASNMLFLDHNLTAGCTGPTVVTRGGTAPKSYNNTINCANTNTISLPVHLGVSDVQGASFHQSGPLGTTVSPLDDTTLNSVATAVVPFALYVGKGVVKLDALGTSPNGPIDGLSRLQIEQVFSRSVTDWQRLGFGTVTDAAPGVLEATSPITLCVRNAGSGTKAAFDETLMINATETGLANASVVFSSSTSGVLSCVAANRRSIGYMDADQVVSFNVGGANAGLAYVSRVDGGLANDPSLTDPKRDLKCGKFAYWSALRMNRRTASEGASIDALSQAFVDNANLQVTISQIPTGAYWASDEEMFVSKNSDKGPLIWKAGNHPECR